MKLVRIVCCLFVVAASLVACLPGTVLAQEGTTPERLEIAAAYPKIQGIITDTFTFELELKYFGTTARDFNLKITGPSGWTIITAPYMRHDNKIASVRLEPIVVKEGETAYGQLIDVVATPASWPTPAPGEYKITLEVSSGNVKNTIDLAAVITASYGLSMLPVSGLYNTKVTAGGSTVVWVELTNTGTAPIDNINFDSAQSQGWRVGVSVSKIDSLDVYGKQQVGLTIEAPPKAVAGDYYVGISAFGTQASASIELRVTVETPITWGVIGIIFIIVVVAGLAYVYMRFRRR